MRNIISGKTLAEVVQSGGWEAAKAFPTRCTGNTLGSGMRVIADLLFTAQNQECKVSSRMVNSRDAYLEAKRVVEVMQLKGFSFGRNEISYKPFENA